MLGDIGVRDRGVGEVWTTGVRVIEGICSVISSGLVISDTGWKGVRVGGYGLKGLDISVCVV